MQKVLAILGFAIAALILVSMTTSCGFNPMEGDYGPVEWVPEKDSCWTKVRHPDSRVNYEMRPCDGKDHDIEVFDRWRF